MDDAKIVFLKTLSLFLVILVGWLARRCRMFTDETTSSISRFVVDFTFPALVFTMILRTVDAAGLRAGWFVPLLAIGVLAIGEIVGLAIMGIFCPRGSRPTFVFLASMPNWIFLPLPIVLALYGDAGARTILLFNIGAQVFLWSIGVWTVRGGRPDWASVRRLAINPGLIATAAGIILAICVPSLCALARGEMASDAGMHSQLIGAALAALERLGSLTIPLSLVVAGVFLGGLKRHEHRPTRPFAGVLLAKLILAPIVTLAVVRLLWVLGIQIPEVARMTTYIISCMPVATTGCVLVQRYGGDTSLAARAAFYTTLLSILTMPAFLFMVQALHL